MTNEDWPLQGVLLPQYNTYGNHQNTAIKQLIFNTNVLWPSYCMWMWRITAADMSKPDPFHRKCTRKILRVFWPNQILNEEMCRRTNTLPLSVKIISKQICRWLRHVLWRDGNSVARISLTWALEGKRRPGRSGTTWGRSADRASEK